MDHKTLKDMLAKDELIQAPGVYDALTAKIAEAQGFNAVYMTGYGVSAGLFGLPDMGLVTMTEMVNHASRIVDAVKLPLIADADTGYGNALNVVRTVRAYEKAGVAAIQIEDQTWPKRCGHMTGKNVISTDEMLGKIKAAVDARKDRNFLIITRTDALAIEGFDAAIGRCRKFVEAGADILFLEATAGREQMEKIPKLLTTKPLLLNMGPMTPNLSSAEIKQMGYAVAIYPGICLAAAISGCIGELKRLKDSGRQRDFNEWIQSFVELNSFLGADHYREMEKKYAVPDKC